MLDYLEGVDEVTDLLEVAIGHDEANVLLDEGEQLLEGGVVRGGLADRLLHHGVLAHKNNSLAEISIIPHFVVWFT